MSQDTFFHALMRNYRSRRRERRYLEAIRQGKYALPAPSVKLAILNNVPEPRPRVFIETGTYHGDTVAAVKHLYSSVISIEVDKTLYEKACKRFEADRNVRIVLGDCARELPGILGQLHEPAVFWLDGHYSAGETGRGELDDPILVSLKQLAAHPIKDHVLFVDDARTFDGREGRPDMADVLKLIKTINDRYIVRVQSDIIVATTVPLPVC